MNAQTFTTLYREHHHGVYCFILGLARNREHAEDVTARAFLKAWEHRKELNGNFKPWLFQIAVNELKTDWRRASHLKMEPLTADHREIPDPRDNGRALESRDEWERAQNAALRLSRKLREVIADALKGFSLGDSARAHNIPYGTAGSRLNAAREQMRSACLS